MTSSLFTRVEKLESRHRTDDHVLLLWIAPGQSVENAVLAANNAGLFGTGDLIMCAEWLGEEPMPKPRWIRRRGEQLSLQESEYCDAMIAKRIAAAEAAEERGTPSPALCRPMPRDLAEVSTVDLIHCALGVET